MVSIPHIVAIPYPAQGHVLPLMELSLWLVREGCKITYVNSEFYHKGVIKSLSETDDGQKKISLVSIPDGLGDEEDRTDIKKLTEAIAEVMPGKLEEVINMINNKESSDEDSLLLKGRGKVCVHTILPRPH